MKTEFLYGLNPGGFHKMAVHHWPCRAPQEHVAICVHGLLRNGRDFDPLAAALSQHTPVFCPDIAGRGLSDKLPDYHDYSFRQYLADMAALIAFTGAKQIDWIGTSMGGVLGMLLAALPNSPIRKLVLNDIGPVVPKAASERIGNYLKGGCRIFSDVKEIEAYFRNIYQPFGIPTDQDWERMAATSFWRLPDGRLTLAYDPELIHAFDAATKEVQLWDVYDKITCPVLLVRGAESDLLTPDIATEMTRRGPRAKLVTIQGAGHAPALMSAQEIKIIENFLRG